MLESDKKIRRKESLFSVKEIPKGSREKSKSYGEFKRRSPKMLSMGVSSNTLTRDLSQPRKTSRNSFLMIFGSSEKKFKWKWYSL